MSLLTQTIESIGWKGWHEHVYDGTVAMVWGIRPHDGCQLCDMADAWLARESANIKTDEEIIRSEIAERRARFQLITGGLSGVRPDPVRYIDPHTPQAVSEEKAPSLDKIITKQEEPKPTAAVAVETKQIDLESVANRVSVSEDEEASPPAPEPPTFKLTHPDEFTLKRGKRKRK